MHQLHLVFQKYDAILFQIAAPFRTASRYQTRKLNSICQRLQLQNAKKREVSVGIFAITAKTGNVSKSICQSPPPGRIECLRSERGNAKVSGELMSDTRPEMSDTRPKVSTPGQKALRRVSLSKAAIRSRLVSQRIPGGTRSLMPAQ